VGQGEQGLAGRQFRHGQAGAGHFPGVHLVAGPVRAVLGGVTGFSGVAVLAVPVAHRFFSWAWPRSRPAGFSVGGVAGVCEFAMFDGAASGAVASGAGVVGVVVVEAPAAGVSGAGVFGAGFSVARSSARSSTTTSAPASASASACSSRFTPIT